MIEGEPVYPTEPPAAPTSAALPPPDPATMLAPPATPDVANWRGAVVTGVVVEGLILLWLVAMSFGSDDGEELTPLREKVTDVLAVGGLTAVAVGLGVVVLGGGRRAANVLFSSVFFAGATVFGFFSGLLIALSRSDVGDH